MEKHCRNEYVSAADKPSLILTGGTITSTITLEDTSYGCGKDVILFQKDQIIGLHQANRTTKESAEITNTGYTVNPDFDSTQRD